MSASPASFAVLGLSPGADRAAVDRAYRALMKRHHPDLGGDAERAAAINRAYAEITRPGVTAAAPIMAGPDLATAMYERRIELRRRAATRRIRRRSRWPWWLLIAALLGFFGWTNREALADLAWTLQWRYFQPAAQTGGVREDEAAAASSDAGNARFSGTPVSETAIRAALTETRAAFARGGIGAARDASSLCYQRFAGQPSLAGFDRCVAIDDAVLFVAGAVVADRGGFGAASLTARQLAAGRLLAGDFDMIEERLDRVRASTLHALQPGRGVVALSPVSADFGNNALPAPQPGRLNGATAL